jgi:hypothetical protein
MPEKESQKRKYFEVKIEDIDIEHAKSIRRNYILHANNLHHTTLSKTSALGKFLT